MPIRRARSLVRANPVAEIPSFTVQHDMSEDLTQLQDGEYVYDSDADDHQTLVDRLPQSSSTGTAALTTIRAPIVLGNCHIFDGRKS